MTKTWHLSFKPARRSNSHLIIVPECRGSRGFDRLALASAWRCSPDWPPQTRARPQRPPVDCHLSEPCLCAEILDMNLTLIIIPLLPTSPRNQRNLPAGLLCSAVQVILGAGSIRNCFTWFGESLLSHYLHSWPPWTRIRPPSPQRLAWPQSAEQSLSWLYSHPSPDCNSGLLIGWQFNSSPADPFSALLVFDRFYVDLTIGRWSIKVDVWRHTSSWSVNKFTLVSFSNSSTITCTVWRLVTGGRTAPHWADTRCTSQSLRQPRKKV